MPDTDLPPAQPRYHGYISVQRRGVVALPAALRERYRLDEPGSQVEITERADGILELRPTVAVSVSEAWFWDERWQAGEQQAERDMTSGDFKTFAGPDELIQHLETLDAE